MNGKPFAHSSVKFDLFLHYINKINQERIEFNKICNGTFLRVNLVIENSKSIERLS